MVRKQGLSLVNANEWIEGELERMWTGGMRENERESIGANIEGGRREEWRSTPSSCEESMRNRSPRNVGNKKDALLWVDS